MCFGHTMFILTSHFDCVTVKSQEILVSDAEEKSTCKPAPLPMLRHCTFRAAKPRAKFRISSKTTARNLKDSSSVRLISATGKPIRRRGVSQSLKPSASCSAGVVVRHKLALCDKSQYLAW